MVIIVQLFKIHSIIHFKEVNFTSINYISIMLFSEVSEKNQTKPFIHSLEITNIMCLVGDGHQVAHQHWQQFYKEPLILIR